MKTPTPIANTPLSVPADRLEHAVTILKLVARELGGAGLSRERAAAAAWYSYPAVLLALSALGDPEASQQSRTYRAQLLRVLERMRPGARLS